MARPPAPSPWDAHSGAQAIARPGASIWTRRSACSATWATQRWRRVSSISAPPSHSKPSDWLAARRDLAQALDDLAGQMRAMNISGGWRTRGDTGSHLWRPDRPRASMPLEPAIVMRCADLSNRSSGRCARTISRGSSGDGRGDTGVRLGEGQTLALDDAVTANSEALRSVTSRAAGAPLRRLATLRHPPQPPGQHQQQDAEDERKEANKPDQRHRSTAGEEKQQQPKRPRPRR